MISPKPYIVVIGMNTKREASRRDEEGIAYMGANDNKCLPQDNQLPILEEIAMGDQLPVVPPSMNDGEIRTNFLNLS